MMGMLWKKGRCRNCNGSVEKEFSYCPNCGNPLKERQEDQEQGFGVIDDMFGQVERQMQQQMQEMDRMFGQEMFVKPKVIMPRGGSGISISIHSGSGVPPKVTVHTFGGAKRLEPQIRQRMSTGPMVSKVEKEEAPRITEEPEMEVRNEGENAVYTVALPEVRRAQDISVKRLPNSVEIRARAGDKLYFKLFEAQPRLSIAEKNFSNGKLTLVMKQE